MSEYHSALVYHSAFDGINHVVADTRNDAKHSENKGIETSRCYCDYRQPKRTVRVGNPGTRN